jgi:hypothetical protein
VYASWPLEQAADQTRRCRVRGAVGQQFGKHHAGHRGERLAVAEERGLVGGQRVDDAAVHVGFGPLLRPRHELGDGGRPGLPRQRHEPRLDEVILARFEHDRRVPAHQAADVGELARGQRHRLTSIDRAGRPPLTRAST